MSVNVCDTKVLYDTRFEAEVAAAHHSTPMSVYACGRHFHLTHAEDHKRIGHGKSGKFARCPHCKQIYVRRRARQAQEHLDKKCLEKNKRF